MEEAKEIIRQVKKLEIYIKNYVDNILAGNYHSVFKGNGVDFCEIREYQAGDDPRAIDWKVTARLNHPFSKVFEEERNLNVFIVQDISGSSTFGDKIEKQRKGIEIAATIMFSALRNHDKIGLVLFSEGVEKFYPPRTGKRHLYELLTNMIRYKPNSQKTNLVKTLNFLTNVIKKRSIIFFISDFPTLDFGLQLKHLKLKHDFIPILISDYNETNLPRIGLIQLEDPETAEQILVDTNDEEFRSNYEKILLDHKLKLQNIFKRNKIEVIELLNQQEYYKPLRKYLMARKRRYR